MSYQKKYRHAAPALSTHPVARPGRISTVRRAGHPAWAGPLAQRGHGVTWMSPFRDAHQRYEAGLSPIPTMLQSRIGSRPSARARATTRAPSAPGFSQTSPIPFRAIFVDDPFTDRRLEIDGGHVDRPGHVEHRRVGGHPLDDAGFRVDRHDVIATVQERPDRLVPELAPVPRRADHGHHPRHRRSIPPFDNGTLLLYLE